MRYETFALSEQYPGATLTTYVNDDPPELNMKPRKAMVVCPGGGYHFLSDREGEPIVKAFLAQGMNVFLLRYTVGAKTDTSAGATDYAPLCEAALAIRHIRLHAEEYNIDPCRIFIVGFSAGGHLAASTGILWKEEAVQKALGASSEEPTAVGKPDGMILSYPVITAGPYAHKGSICNLCGTKTPTDAEKDLFSLEKHVDSTTSPAFIWHTQTDTCVPVQNSFLLADAMLQSHVPFELHMYPEGVHGLSLANEETWSQRPNCIVPHVQTWITLAAKWVEDFGAFGPRA